MWKKGDVVWVNLPDKCIPGRILDPSEAVGVFVSFFGLMEPRYVPKPCLRSFEYDFDSLISDSWTFCRFVNRALLAHFWNISFGLWCPCQPPIDSLNLDRENSLPWFPLTSDSALGFVRDMAISQRVTLRRLAETNSSTAQILSFRRYTIDFKRSESVYEEIRASTKLMDHSEESGWCLDPSNKMDCIDMVSMYSETADPDVENSRDLSLRDPLPKDIPCCSSLSSEQPVGEVVRIYTWNTRNPLTNSRSSIIKACETTTARTADHEDDGHPSKTRERCQVEQSICLLNSKPPIEDIIEEATTSVAVSEAHPVVMIETHDNIIGSDDRTATSGKQLSPLPDASNNKAVPEACETLACSVKETYAKPRNKPDSSLISAKTLNKENAFTGIRENCSNDALESYTVEVGEVSLHITGISNKEFSSDDVGIAPAEQLQDLDTAATVENQARSVDNIRSRGVKRKASRNKASAGNSKRKKKAGQQSVSTADNPHNLHLLKDMRLADPKCLRIKFLSRHGNLPSKAELLKRFSVFGKIDGSRTDVNLEKSSAKVVFLQSIDAVTAYQFARSKKFTLGRSKVMFRLDPFEEASKVCSNASEVKSLHLDSEVNKVPMLLKPQKSVPMPKSCLKKHGLADKEEERRNLKVKFRMESNS